MGDLKHVRVKLYLKFRWTPNEEQIIKATANPKSYACSDR